MCPSIHMELHKEVRHKVASLKITTMSIMIMTKVKVSKSTTRGNKILVRRTITHLIRAVMTDGTNQDISNLSMKELSMSTRSMSRQTTMSMIVIETIDMMTEITETIGTTIVVIIKIMIDVTAVIIEIMTEGITVIIEMITETIVMIAETTETTVIIVTATGITISTIIALQTQQT